MDIHVFLPIRLMNDYVVVEDINNAYYSKECTHNVHSLSSYTHTCKPYKHTPHTRHTHTSHTHTRHTHTSHTHTSHTHATLNAYCPRARTVSIIIVNRRRYEKRLRTFIVVPCSNVNETVTRQGMCWPSVYWTACPSSVFLYLLYVFLPSFSLFIEHVAIVHVKRVKRKMTNLCLDSIAKTKLFIKISCNKEGKRRRRVGVCLNILYERLFNYFLTM